MRQRAKRAGLLAIAAFGVAFVVQPQERAGGTRVMHGASLVDTLKYPQGFKNFDYVNPNAPNGGRIRVEAPIASFDSFNGFIVQGTPDVWAGNLLYETLMVSSYDQPSTMYGGIAESLEMPNDYSWVIFKLRAAARFHDGAP